MPLGRTEAHGTRRAVRLHDVGTGGAIVGMSWRCPHVSGSSSQIAGRELEPVGRRGWCHPEMRATSFVLPSLGGVK